MVLDKMSSFPSQRRPGQPTRSQPKPSAGLTPLMPGAGYAAKSAATSSSSSKAGSTNTRGGSGPSPSTAGSTVASTSLRRPGAGTGSAPSTHKYNAPSKAALKPNGGPNVRNFFSQWKDDLISYESHLHDENLNLKREEKGKMPVYDL